MSGNADTSVVLRGITHGAEDYLLKPVRIEELRNLWQHVIRKRHHPETRVRDGLQAGSEAPDDNDSDEECGKRKGFNTVKKRKGEEEPRAEKEQKARTSNPCLF